jgi:hypothetical protein
MLMQKGARAMSEADVHINFNAPAILRKAPSMNKERISSATAYTVVEGTLDECIRQFTSKPISQHHLYDIHTTAQGEMITEVMSAKQISELVRLRDFL